MECCVGLHGIMFHGGCLTSERLARIILCSVNISACWWWTAQDWSKVSWEPVYGPCLELKWVTRLLKREREEKSIIFDGSGVGEDDYKWKLGHKKMDKTIAWSWGTAWCVCLCVSLGLLDNSEVEGKMRKWWCGTKKARRGAGVRDKSSMGI